MRAVVVIAVSLITLAYVGIPMFMHPPSALTGVTAHYTGALVQPNIVDVAAGSPGYRAGLRSGDIVGCLSQRDNLILSGSGFRPGTAIRLCVTHNGVRRTVSFVPSVGPPTASIYGSDALAAVRLVGYALFLLCAAVLVLGRPGLMTWLFFWYTIVGAPSASVSLAFTVLSPAFYAITNALSASTGLAESGLLLAFTILVPDDAVPAGWRRIALWTAYGLSAVLAALGFANYVVTAFTLSPSIVEGATIGGTVLVLIAVLARLATTQREDRARFGWAAFAIGWAVVIDALRLSGASGILPQHYSSYISLFAVVTPVVLLYAVLKRHIIDIRFVVSRTLVYAIITTFVIAIIGVVDWATSAYLHEAKVAMALDAIATIGVAFALNRVHRWVERIVDVALFKKKYAAEEYLDSLGPTLLEAQREETIHGELARAPVRALDLTLGAVFRATETAFVVCASAGPDAKLPPAFDRDHELVRFLNAGRSLVRLDRIAFESRADLAIPILQGKRLTGFVLYGRHSDGTNLDPDEVETLKRFCECAAQAYISITYERYNALPQATLAATP